jgi:predicted RNase H-like HicB family nuclease
LDIFMTAQELWQIILERLREHLPPAAANDWFAETAALSLVGDVLIVALKSMTPLFKLEHRYQDVLNAHLAAIMGRPIQVEYVYHPRLARLFDSGKLSPDVLSSRVKHDLNPAKILILIEEQEGSYAACAPDVPQSYVTGDSREEVLHRLRKVIQEQLEPLYEEHVPVSLPHITAEYLDLTQSD